jgi:hypothetical protein
MPPGPRRRKGGSPASRGAQQAPPHKRASGKQRVFLAVIAAVLVLGGTRAFIAWRSARPGAAPPARAADPAAGMSVVEAAGNAARLYRADRAYESLPYYRRVSPEIAPGRLDFRLEFATALEHASLQAAVESEERVHLMLECMDQLARTESAVERPRDRARVIVARAFFLRVWGFPMDAVAELHRALETDPTYPDLATTVRLMERRVREPLLPFEALEGPGLGY